MTNSIECNCGAAATYKITEPGTYKRTFVCGECFADMPLPKGVWIDSITHDDVKEFGQ